MELVYLWVEDYKNIQKQGFNFSPRFECKFDGENLTIQENKDYIENFFGNNINVTAIVGKNGSGKSSILNAYTQIYDMFFQSLGEELEMDVKTVKIVSILILKIQDHNVVFTNMKLKLNDDSFIKLFFQDNQEVSMNTEFIMDLITNYPKLLFYDNYFSKFIPQNQFLFKGAEENEFYNKNTKMSYQNTLIIPKKIGNNLIEENEKVEKQNLLNYFIIKKDNYVHETDTFFEPYEIFISKNEEYIDGNLEKVDTFIDFELYVIKKYLKDIIEEVFKHIDAEKVLEPYKNDLDNPNHTLVGNKNKNKLLQEVETSLDINKLIIFFYDIRSNVFISSVEPILRLSFEKEFDAIKEYLRISVDNNKKNELLKFHSINEKKSHNIKVNTSILKESDLEFLLKLPKCFRINIFDKNDIEYINLSSGEKELLKIRFYIENYIYENKDKNVSYFILLDEPTNYLNPNWQKKLLDFFINAFRGRKEKIHFAITTHSPFLLSDIPKQNIIFLDKEKNGNCKVLTNDEVLNKKQTFGANIHTLLSDSFFMDDGLMGEFAKSKINDVYNFIVHHKTDKIKTKEEAQQIIDIVGDTLIQRELQQLFDKKFELSSMSLDDEINQLEKKLKALKEINK